MMRHVEKEHKAMDWRPGVIEELLEGVVDFLFGVLNAVSAPW